MSGIALLAPNPYPGSMIQAFSGLSSVILAAPGFIAKHNIEVQHSFITLKSINYAKQA
ncbi:MAG: hypothetical protein LW630_09405 [Saprospiraceae bacterium]|nr:hypothetical protein [Saprospiraceae bacterium]